MRITVNADDLGSSPRVNDAIFRCIESGAVGAASILANGRAFDDAVRRARDFPGCAFGVHLNVTEGAPLAPEPELAPLLDADGEFLRYAIRREAMRPAVRRAVFREWSRQIERLNEAGIRVSHIDSHHHVHTLPWLFGTLKALQRAFGIRRVRGPGRLPLAAQPFSLSGAAKGLWRHALCVDGTVTSDYFCSLEDYHRLPAADMPTGDATVELMVHPGLDKYRDETALLSSEPWTRSAPAD